MSMGLEATQVGWAAWNHEEASSGARRVEDDERGLLAFLVAVAMVWGAVLGGAIGYLIGRLPG